MRFAGALIAWFTFLLAPAFVAHGDDAPTTQSTPDAAPLGPSVEARARVDVGDDAAIGVGRAVQLEPTQPVPVAPIKRDVKKGELVVAPIPAYDPSQEFVLALVGQYLFHPDPNDTVSPPSIVALVGVYTQEDSFALGGAYIGFLDEDRWRVLLGFGAGQFNYDFYGIGSDAAALDKAVGVEQGFYGGVGQVTRQVFPHFYIGPRVQAFHSDVNFDTSDVPFPLPALEFEADNVALGIKLQYDTRDSTLYPTRGLLIEAQLDLFSETFGGDFDYRSYQLAYNQYFPVSEKGVLAVRGFYQGRSGDIPFFDLATFGSGADLRGYEAGKYRDKSMFDVQAEYRYLLTRWLGLAAFAGVGEVMPDIGSINADDLLWSGGFGVRIRLAKENPIFYRIDVAGGDDGVAVYMGIGQAF